MTARVDPGRAGETTRMCISVPLDLKRAMVRYPRVNWSRVAARAFQARVDAEAAAEGKA